MDEKLQAALKVVDEVCAGFKGNRRDHAVINESLGIIYAALTPTTEEIKKEEDDG